MARIRSFSPRWLVPALLVVPLVAWALNAGRTAEQAVVIPAPAVDAAAPAGAGLQTIVVAGGCFWGVQAVFQHTKGVTAAVSGYAGGEQADRALRDGRQRPHRPRRVGRDHLRSAADFATARFCRSISPSRTIRPSSTARDPTSARNTAPPIFYANDDQKRIADAYIAELDKAHAFSRPIVTQLEPLSGFYPAEDYHQDFAVLHPSYPYIVFNDLPEGGKPQARLRRRLSRHAGHRDGVEQAEPMNRHSGHAVVAAARAGNDETSPTRL